MGSGVFKAIGVGFLCGIFARSLCAVGFSVVLYLIMLAIAALAYARFDRMHARALILCALALCAGAAGIMRMEAAAVHGDPALSSAIGKHIVLTGFVAAEPDARDAQVRIDLDATRLDAGSTTLPVSSGVLVELPPHTVVRYGDIVRVSGVLDLPRSFDTDNGGSFDYPDYLAASGIGYELSFAHASSTGANAGNPLFSAVIALKERYARGLDAVLPEPEAGLAAGITVGDKRSIGPELSADFQKVGLVQMVVLSGYNITVVTDFVARLLAWSPGALRFGAGVSVAVFFVAISGGGSSAVRAAIMAMIALYARMSGRTFDALRALLAAAVVMAAWNPFVLAFDPGFQLSALAMLGLATLAPRIAARLVWVPARFGLREIISATIATQAIVAPLILYQDGTLSLLSLPANVLAMLPVPLAMLCSFIAAIGGMSVGSTAAWVAAPAYALLWYIVTVGRLLASLPWASLAVGAIPGYAVLLVYGAIFAAAALSPQKERPGKS